MLEFIDYEDRSFDYGEYAFAQDAPCERLVIDDFPVTIAVFKGKGEIFLAAREVVKKTRSLKIAV